MAKRITLYVDDSRVPVGVTHYIYRHTEPGIIPGPDAVSLMEFREDNYPLSVCTMVDEVLTQDADNSQCFHASRVICLPVQHPDKPWEYSVTVKINGEEVPEEGISIDGPTGRIWITDRSIPPYFGGTVTATYKYHAFVVKDSELAPPELTHRGPVATGLLPPVNGSLAWDSEAKAVVATWEPNPNVITYFYISRYKDSDGRVSEWSDEVNTTLVQDAADLVWHVSRVGDLAEEAGTVTETRFADHMLASAVPHQITPAFTILSAQNVLVEMLNPFTQPMVERETYSYEVRLQDDQGAQSAALFIPATIIHVGYSRILLRRKVHNGTHCSVDGEDAVTLFDYGPDKTDDIVYYDDTLLIDPNTFCYTVFLWDETGDMARPRSWVVNTQNGTITELGVSGDETNLAAL